MRERPRQDRRDARRAARRAGLVAGGCLQARRGRSRVRPAVEGSSREPTCGRRAVQPGGIGQPGPQLCGGHPAAVSAGREPALTRPLDRQDQPIPRDRRSPARHPTGSCRPYSTGDPGRTQVELRDWPAAAATLDRLLAEFPENPYRREARFLRAEAALQLGDARRGRVRLRRAPGRAGAAGRCPGPPPLGPPGAGPLLGGAQALEGPDPRGPGACGAS